MTDKVEERRVGYWGRDTIAVGAALGGVLHLEATLHSHTALCNGKRLNYCAPPSSILEDRGYVINTLRICKRCEKRAKR